MLCRFSGRASGGAERAPSGGAQDADRQVRHADCGLTVHLQSHLSLDRFSESLGCKAIAKQSIPRDGGDIAEQT